MRSTRSLNMCYGHAMSYKSYGGHVGQQTHQHPNRRWEILAFIGEFIEDHRYPPAIRDMCDHFELSSATVMHYLHWLRKHGFIDWVDGLARTIHLTKSDAPAGVSDTRKDTGCEPESPHRQSSSPSASRRAQPEPEQPTTTAA